MTSEEVMDEFKASMKAMSKERLKNRYIDVEPFYNMCKYIDWHEVFYSEDKLKKRRTETEKIMEIYGVQKLPELPEVPE